MHRQRRRLVAPALAHQRMLLDALEIEQVLCVLGGSMGGMQVLQWAASYPKRVFSALPKYA